MEKYGQIKDIRGWYGIVIYMKEMQKLRFQMKLLENQVRVLWKHIERIDDGLSKLREGD